MRVFVAGASGAVGRRLVPMLVARGYQVTGTTTSKKNVESIRALGAEPVVVDGLDAAGIGEAVARSEPDAIIHQMTALSSTPDFKHFDRWFALTNRLRTEGTENLLAAAKASGVQRFVAQSFTGWSNERTGGWIKTEDDPLDPHPVAEQRETLAAIRFLERAVLEAPLDGIVVRYGGLYGPGSSEKLVEILRKRMFPVIGDGDTGYGNPMNVRRTVAGYAAAGFASVMIEDQLAPKRCGHTRGKSVVSRQEALGRVTRGRTTVVVAHRLSTVVDADRIVVLRAGRIVEEGRHAELLARGGYYAKLVEKQTRGLFPMAA